MAVDGLPNPNEKDLDILRSSGRRRYSRLFVKGTAGFIGLLFGALIALYAVHRYRGEALDPAILQNQLTTIGAVWSDELADEMDRYRGWLQTHGTKTESTLFDDVSIIIAQSAISIAASSESGPNDMSLFSTLYVALHGGVLRLMFLVLASLRLWIVTILFAVAWGINSFKAYKGDDVLGQMGNGRLFYSGVRAGLEKLASDGAPDVQVRGLACPAAATQSETKASSVWRVLEEFGAANATNEALAAIIVKHASTQPYVTWPDEEGMLKSVFSGDSLEENAAQLLSVGLALRGLYAAGDLSGTSFERSQARADNELVQNSEQYSQSVRSAMHRVLSPALRQIIGEIPVTEVATAILAFECGKVLAHSYEGGRWVRRSNFPQLAARAVLHSVLSYPEDYTYEARNRIRRALIYSSRRSSFAPVRMPVDMTEDCWALRQWIEILMACPHELDAVCDEVEMAGLVRSAHHKWIQEFLDGAVAFTPDIAQSSYSTPSNLLFVPLSRVITLLRKGLDAASIRRLEQLVAVVSSRQKLQTLEAQNSDQGSPDGPGLERVLPLLTEDEIKELSSVHGLPPDQIKDWSALRIVLTSYGWLARRVGDYSVPDSSVIFAVLKAEAGQKDANALGLIGRCGMVPFRGSKLEGRWGRNWAHRFLFVNGATMAESTEDYQKLLAGIKEKDDIETLEGLTPVTA